MVSGLYCGQVYMHGTKYPLFSLQISSYVLIVTDTDSDSNLILKVTVLVTTVLVHNHYSGTPRQVHVKTKKT